MEPNKEEQPQSSKALNAPKGDTDVSKDRPKLDIEILPAVYDILRCFEKDPIGKKERLQATQNFNKKVEVLQERFKSAREQINQLPGIDRSKEGQREEYDELSRQLTVIKQLLAKYKQMKF